MWQYFSAKRAMILFRRRTQWRTFPFGMKHAIYKAEVNPNKRTLDRGHTSRNVCLHGREKGGGKVKRTLFLLLDFLSSLLWLLLELGEMLPLSWKTTNISLVSRGNELFACHLLWLRRTWGHAWIILRHWNQQRLFERTSADSAHSGFVWHHVMS